MPGGTYRGLWTRLDFFTELAAAVASLLACYFAGSAAGDGRIGGVIAAGLWALASGDLALQANQPDTRVFLSIELVQRKLPAVF
jgi:hypothetical protein